jgi:hypothetical protein
MIKSSRRRPLAVIEGAKAKVSAIKESDANKNVRSWEIISGIQFDFQ